MLGRSRFALRRLSRFCLMSHAICFRFGVDMRNRGLNAELIPKKSVVLQNGPLSAEGRDVVAGAAKPVSGNGLTID